MRESQTTLLPAGIQAHTSVSLLLQKSRRVGVPFSTDFPGTSRKTSSGAKVLIPLGLWLHICIVPRKTSSKAYRIDSTRVPGYIPRLR